MTDCHLALPESLIMQTEALAANHSNYRNEGALGAHLGEEKEGKEVVIDSPPPPPSLSRHESMCFVPRNKQQKSTPRVVGLAFL